MNLYDLHRGSKFKLLASPDVPPFALEGSLEMTYTLGAIDGMYSWSIGEDGGRYYFAAYTEVEEIKND